MVTIHDDAADLALTLGQRLRAMRESRDWTQETLAQRSGLSKAYLSRLEAGDRQASIAALLSIAKSFDVSIAALFEQPDESTECVIVRGGTSSAREVNGLSYVALSSSTKPFNVHPIRVAVPANRKGVETYQHDGEEWLHVTAGRLRLSIDGKEHVLVAGDSAHFDSRLPHRLDAMDGVDATVVLVACAIPLSMNRRRREAAAGRVVG